MTQPQHPNTPNFNELSFDNAQSLSDSDWQARLDPQSYHILRQKGTERPFSGFYTDTTDTGVYRCKGCHAKLFDSRNKFDAGCGWPSFDDIIDNGVVTERLDTSHGMRRIEVTCSNCGGHLGHVFPDGPSDTTGLRYCINSLALLFDKQSDS